MQRFLDVDIPWLFVMESQLSPALPILALPTAVAVAYLTNRQALATKTDYSPLPNNLKIEELNSPNILTTKHDSLHSFVGWIIKPKIIEHEKKLTNEEIELAKVNAEKQINRKLKNLDNLYKEEI